MRNLRTEEEIISSWKGDIEKPVVSICCISYNHESYIEDALEGFLIQETDFSFEILIHDDASTDRTADIIREYEAKYPKLIKPIYQTENQYSKGIKVNPVFNFSRVIGGYIALCEGDDCWVSATKLKKQFNLCDENNYSVVFHSAKELDVLLGAEKIVSCARRSSGEVDLVDSVKGRGAFMPTASLFFPSELILDKVSWFDHNFPIGDFFLQMILSYSGKIYYLDEPMCIYRRNSIGSWTANQKSRDKTIEYNRLMRVGVLKLYDHMKDKNDIHLLAYPYFFYSKGYLSKSHNNFYFFLELIKDTPVKKTSVKFSFFCFFQLFSLSWGFIERTISRKKL